MSGDTLSDVLQAVRLTGAAFFRVRAGAPWVASTPAAREIAGFMLPRAQHVFAYHVLARGECWGRVDGEEPVRVGPGDVVVFPHGDAHVFSSGPALRGRAQMSIYRQVAHERRPFELRLGANSDVTEADLVCGYLGCDTRPFNPLLASLPRMIHVVPAGGDDVLSQAVRIAVTESEAKRAGGEAVLARISELMFVEVVRRYLATVPRGETGWFAGLSDPHVGRALELLHASVEREWSLEELAREAGLSRSSLAERFTELVGHPPMQYLALWRMQVAAGLLSGGTDKIAAVAARVGYGSEAAFSRAFKRATGESPAAWRARARA